MQINAVRGFIFSQPNPKDSVKLSEETSQLKKLFWYTKLVRSVYKKAIKSSLLDNDDEKQNTAAAYVVNNNDIPITFAVASKMWCESSMYLEESQARGMA